MHRILCITLMISLCLSCQKKKNLVSEHPRYTLRMAILAEPMHLDPRKGADVTSAQLQFMLFEGLTRLHADGTIELGQSHKIDVTKDQKTYTFHLGKTTWSDGTIVTSYDFEKAWKDILSPCFPAPNAHLLYPIKGALSAKTGTIDMREVGISAPDPYTLIIELENPTPYFLQLISFCTFFPVKSGLDEQSPSLAYTTTTAFINNGPFCLKEWKHDDHLILTKNTRFRAPQEVHLEKIQLQVIPNELTAIQMYENGDLDFIGNPFCSLPAEEISAAMQKGTLHITPAAATTFLSLNTEGSLFKNIHLRKAFAYAINREELVRHISPLQEVIATDAIPPILKNNQVRHLYTDNKPKLAKMHLKQALLELNLTKKDLEGLSFLYAKVEDHHKMAQAIQQQILKTLGIRIQLQSMESKTLLSKLSTRDYSLALSVWRAQFSDPISILERFKHKQNVKNYPGWQNLSFQQLLEESTYYTGDHRQRLLDRAEEILLDEFPVIPLYHWNLCFCKKDHLTNIELSPVGGIFFERLMIKEITDKT